MYDRVFFIWSLLRVLCEFRAGMCNVTFSLRFLLCCHWTAGVASAQWTENNENARRSSIWVVAAHNSVSILTLFLLVSGYYFYKRSRFKLKGLLMHEDSSKGYVLFWLFDFFSGSKTSFTWLNLPQISLCFSCIFLVLNYCSGIKNVGPYFHLSSIYC